MSKNVYTLTSPEGITTELPAYKGSTGPDVVDIGSLYREQGVFTYDPGFVATASCDSDITFIDGDKGVLMYRGYPVEQLAKKSNFIEVAFLLRLRDERRFDGKEALIAQIEADRQRFRAYLEGDRSE